MSARRAIAIFCFSVSIASCAPILTDTQKLAIRDAQIKVAMLDARRAKAEAEYREISSQLKQAAQDLDAAVAKVTPSGYKLPLDLTLIPEKKR
jgi:hypothetical protein